MVNITAMFLYDCKATLDGSFLKFSFLSCPLISLSLPLLSLTQTSILHLHGEKLDKICF